MSATEAVEMELGRTGGNEESGQWPVASGQEDSGQSSVVSCQAGAEPELTEEQVKKLSAFITDRPKGKAPKTAKEKRLAKQQKLVAKEIEVLKEWGDALNVEQPYFEIREGGRRQKVPPREWLMAYLLKIRNKNGRLQALRVNAAQREYAKNATKRSIVLKARQLGITTYVAARFFLNCVTRPGTMCVQVAHDQRSAEEIFRIVHRLLANMPDVLRKGALATSHANKRQIIFPHLDSQYRVEAADENAGRGLTIQYLHCSEVSRWPGDAEATLAALRAAVPPDGEIVLESTANGAAGCFYEEWQRAEQMGYSRHFYPWWWEPSYQRPVQIVEFTEEEAELMQKHKLTAEQIGFRREIKANFGRRAKEEFAEDAESCFLASGDCIFDVDVIDQRLHEELPVMGQTDGGRSITFFPPQPGNEYIIGVDPAGGGSEGDYSCAQVIDRASGMQVAELRGHLTPEETAARVAILARQYNKALVAVERNNHGHAVLGYLSMVHADVARYHVKGNEGWLTSMATRPMMLLNLAGVLAAAPHLFNSARLLEECKTFVRRPDSTTGAANGAHDDTVMAMAIALAVRAEVVGMASAARAQVEVGVL
jgi:Terminase RNaseH-like domain